MDHDETPFALPQDVPPLLQDAEESLYRVIGNASRVRRNTQKILHLIARCINIIEDLKCSISPPPSTFEKMITDIESVRKLEILLVKFDGAVTTEASLPASLNHGMIKTWESSRKEFYELLKEAYGPEFKPSNSWEKGVEQVSRLDDYLWVSLIAQDMRSKGIDGAQKAETIAAGLLEGDQDPSNLNSDIETVMSDWKMIAESATLPSTSETTESNRIRTHDSDSRTGDTAQSSDDEQVPAVLTRFATITPPRSRSPWRMKSPSKWGKDLLSPYLETLSKLSLSRSRQSSSASLSTVEGPSTSASETIFGAPLEQSVAIANVALQLRDAVGELKTWGYIPVIVAKCGAALKDCSEQDQNATMKNFHKYVAPKEDSVRQLRQRYSKPPEARPYGKHEKWDKYPSAKVPALATALLMHYLSDLPVALVPDNRFAEFATIHEDSKRGDSPQTTTTRYFELLCDLPPSNMYLLMYLAETLDYIGRHARVEVADLAKTFANCVFRPQHPSRPLETAIEILKDLISHRNLDARRADKQSVDVTDEQSVDVTVRGSTLLDYAVSLAQQHGVPCPDIEIQEAESIDDNPTTDTGAESAESTPLPTGQTVKAAEQSSFLTADSGPWSSTSSLEGVPDLSEYIKKDKDAGKKWGGFYEVYVGYFKNLESGEQLPVALRLPNIRHALDATQRRFIHEVKLWFGLKHQNINPLLGTFVDEQGIHMVSPWRRRGDVFSLLKAKNLTSVDLRKILLGVSSALCYLHNASYVHGDLKMENVLLADDGEPLLTDFGLSKGENISVMTSTGNGACSYPWSAPEILMGDPKSKSSDVYAFGMMIIETLTWNQPFAAYKVAGALMLAIMDGRRPERKEVIHELAPPYWESLWELAESCWPQAATARPPMPHVHGMLTRVMSQGWEI